MSPAKLRLLCNEILFVTVAILPELLLAFTPNFTVSNKSRIFEYIKNSVTLFTLNNLINPKLKVELFTHLSHGTEVFLLECGWQVLHEGERVDFHRDHFPLCQIPQVHQMLEWIPQSIIIVNRKLYSDKNNSSVELWELNEEGKIHFN